MKKIIACLFAVALLVSGTAWGAVDITANTTTAKHTLGTRQTINTTMGTQEYLYIQLKSGDVSNALAKITAGYPLYDTTTAAGTARVDTTGFKMTAIPPAWDSTFVDSTTLKYTRSKIAGFSVAALTPGNYGWMLVKGKAKLYAGPPIGTGKRWGSGWPICASDSIGKVNILSVDSALVSPYKGSAASPILRTRAIMQALTKNLAHCGTIMVADSCKTAGSSGGYQYVRASINTGH